MSDEANVTVLWAIENFRHCSKELDEVLSSKVFYTKKWYSNEHTVQSEWKLDVYPNSEDKIKVFLHNISNSSYLLIDYEFSFLSKDGSVLWSGDEHKIEIESDASYDVAAYPSREEVCENRIEEYLPRGTLTVRCRIWEFSPKLYNLFTRIAVERQIFHLAVQNFSRLRNSRSNTYNVIRIDKSLELLVEITLTATIANKTNISIALEPGNRIFSKFFSTCKITVLNTEGSIMKESEEESYFFKSGSSNIWKFPEFLTKNELTAKKRKYLKGDTLNFLFNFTFSTGEEYSNIECVTSMPSWMQTSIGYNIGVGNNLQNTSLNDVPGPSQGNNIGESLAILQKDFLSLYQDVSSSDFELRSESTSFPVHKNVLAARSPVFKVMFASGMKEGKNNFMDIPDVDADTLEKLLVFIYTGRVENMEWSSTSKLYYAADKYDVFSLRQECSSLLTDCLSDSNVGEILILADRHNDDALKSAVHDFIVINDETIIRSNKWKQFLRNNHALGAETMQLIYSKKLDMLAKY